MQAPVKLSWPASHALGVGFFDYFPHKKIPVSDHNLHQIIFWRKLGQSLFGDIMKRKRHLQWWMQQAPLVKVEFLFLGAYG